MNSLMILVSIISAAVVMVRCICIMSAFSPRRWYNHPILLLGNSAAYSLLAGGAAGTAFGLTSGGYVLLAGVACLFVFERRGRTC